MRRHGRRSHHRSRTNRQGRPAMTTTTRSARPAGPPGAGCRPSPCSLPAPPPPSASSPSPPTTSATSRRKSSSIRRRPSQRTPSSPPAAPPAPPPSHAAARPGSRSPVSSELNAPVAGGDDDHTPSEHHRHLLRVLRRPVVAGPSHGDARSTAIPPANGPGTQAPRRVGRYPNIAGSNAGMARPVSPGRSHRPSAPGVAE